jgi:hypothetical protein
MQAAADHCAFLHEQMEHDAQMAIQDCKFCLCLIQAQNPGFNHHQATAPMPQPATTAHSPALTCDYSMPGAASNNFAPAMDLAVTNQLVTCSFRPNTVSPESSPTYNHPLDHCLATRTHWAPAQALADHSPHLLICGALSTQLNVESAPALIQRRLRNLP